jgi:hypothetical protein
VKKHQSLTADIFTLRNIHLKPETIREVACTKPAAIFLPNDLNKDPPSIA